MYSQQRTDLMMPSFSCLIGWLLSILSLIAAATGAAAPVTAPSCVHSPENRQFWMDGYDINTDFDLEAPQGKLVEYDFTITQQMISPDGYEMLGMVVNGQYPGPTLEADWGDTIRIHVHNNLTNHNGTGMHWHGIRQFHTNWLDGVPGVTQCPSSPGETQTYEFRAMQYGTAWYHAHFSLQYTNGIAGPIVIHGPSSANYDEDLGPFQLSDWYHSDAFGLWWEEISGPHAPLPNSTIVNGKGVFSCNPAEDSRCTGLQQREEKIIQKGRKYKINLINTASLLTYTFWIDGHNFTVIQTDFVPIVPWTTEVLNIAIGQRYEIIVEANDDDEEGSAFWMHAAYCDLHDFHDSRVGILRVGNNSVGDPPNATIPDYIVNHGCSDPSPSNLVPIVPKTVGPNSNGFEPSDWLRLGLVNWPNYTDPNEPLHKWVLANETLYLNWSQPSLKTLAIDQQGMEAFPTSAVPIELDYPTGDWVYFVIENNYTLHMDHMNRSIPRSVHPIHLHGHDFLILAQGDGQFSADIKPNLSNPTRRDVADVPIGGYLWIAFTVDNPGAWLLHCHIAWHVSSGFALQFIEQRSKIRALMEDAGVLDEFDHRCRDWSSYYETFNVPGGAHQDDSGV